nr:very short patch repair endonuclease [Amycolatopsis anabasis]
MSRQKSRNFRCAKACTRVGLRCRIHRRPVKGVRREADIVFGPIRVAVFVDGCLEHVK